VILCDVMPMGVFHVLLGRPWKFAKKIFMMEGEMLILWRRMELNTHCYH